MFHVAMGNLSELCSFLIIIIYVKCTFVCVVFHPPVSRPDIQTMTNVFVLSAVYSIWIGIGDLK